MSLTTGDENKGSNLPEPAMHYAQVPWKVRITPDAKNKLSKVSAADCFQVRSISEHRFTERVGVVSATVMEPIREGLAAVLSIHF